MENVIILQRIIPHYRLPLYQRLYKELLKENIQLTVIYGQERVGTVPKSIVIDEPWAIKIENHYFLPFGKEVVWQPCLSLIKEADLIVFEQANRLLVNYLLISRIFNKKAKLAFWGHGQNFQSDSKTGLLENWKKLFNNATDWWFSYTSLSSSIIHASGFSSNKITTLNNAIDDSELSIAKQALTSADILRIKSGLNIKSDSVAIYCGGMYAEKRIDFLLDACEKIRQKTPDFQIIFIGDGPDHLLIKNAAVKHEWIHYLGKITGAERVPYFLMSQLLLMPGLVGLVVLDSFVLETPIVTTDVDLHSPEISYLKNNKNGLMVRDDLDDYVDAVVDVFSSSNKLLTLKQGCIASTKLYSLDNMVSNFSNGIQQCLKL